MIRFATGWKEDVAADEEARFERQAQDLVAIQAGRDAKYGEKARALHRKVIGGFAAEFVVRDDLATVLPDAMQLGPFRPGARWKAYVRLSNGTWDRNSDKAPDVRGVAIKLLGVPGVKVLTGSEDPRTQDFLLIAQSSIAAKTSDEFVALAKVASTGSQATVPLRLAFALGPLRAFAIVSAFVKTSRVPFAGFPGGTYYTATPYELGPAAVKYRIVPRAEVPTPAPDRDMYGAQARILARSGFTWDFQVQAWQDAARTPIEDPSVEWTDVDAPFVTVASLVVTAQDADAEAGKSLAATIESLVFDPWHACVGMRPLGGINRARKAAYYASAQSRGAAPDPSEAP